MKKEPGEYDGDRLPIVHLLRRLAECGLRNELGLRG